MDRLEYIDSFFRNELPPGEKQRFEQKILEDPSFAGEVAFYCRSMQMIKDQNDAEKKDRFRQLYYENASEKAGAKPPVRKMLSRFVAVAAVITALIAGWFLFITPDSPRQLAEQYISTKLDTVGVKMGATQDSLQLALEMYNQGKYSVALPLFQEISPADVRAVEAKKMSGLIYLQTNNYAKAIATFREIEENKALYSNPGKFYHALTLMKRDGPGDKQAAVKLLKDVVREDLEEKETARKWLDELE